MTSNRIRVLAVDDHALLLQGLTGILETAPDIEWVGAARDGLEATVQYAALRPDVTVMDVQMPVMNGIDALRAIRERHSDAKVILLSVHRSEAQARQAFDAGAAGYLLKSMVQRDLCEAIRTVHGGGRHIPVQIALELANGVADPGLSESEIDVLRLVSRGLSNRRIGITLEVPEETVKSRMKSILAKLAANDRTHAVTIALKRGIIDLD